MALSNAASDAYRSLVGSTVGLLNGTNSVTQTQIANLIGVNIPGAPLISSRDYFLLQLNSWISTPALGTQWIAVIDTFPSKLSSSILRALERTGGSSTSYDIDVAKTLLTSFAFQKVCGCVFCNRFEIPGESYGIEEAKLDNNRGFVPGIIAGPRQSYAQKTLSLDFFENNTSFIDVILRPWVILASHYGHVTRKDSKYKISTNITLLCYNRTYQNVSMIPRKVFKFYNCVPYDVSMQALEYGENSQIPHGNVKFSYTNYTVDNGLYMPLPQIITSISNS